MSNNLKNQKGVAALVIIVILVVVIVAGVVFYFTIFRKNQASQAENPPPPGVVTDSEGYICETQDPINCHQEPDFELAVPDNLL